MLTQYAHNSMFRFLRTRIVGILISGPFVFCLPELFGAQSLLTKSLLALGAGALRPLQSVQRLVPFHFGSEGVMCFLRQHCFATRRRKISKAAIPSDAALRPSRFSALFLHALSVRSRKFIGDGMQAMNGVTLPGPKRVPLLASGQLLSHAIRLIHRRGLHFDYGSLPISSVATMKP